MTEMDRAKYDAVWTVLDNLEKKYDRGVTAGEVAEGMGISRNTAVKYLKELIVLKTVQVAYVTMEYEEGFVMRKTLYHVIR